MVGKAQVWGHFGAWDFKKALAWFELRNLPRADFVDELTGRFSMDTPLANRWFDEIQNVKSKNDVQRAANSWIAPWPSYSGGLSSCTVKKTDIACANGAAIINNTALVQTPQGTGLLKHAVIVDPATGIAQEDLFNSKSNIDLVGVFIPSANGIRSVLAQEEVANSLFTRLYFMDGQGLEHFTLVSSEELVTGGRVDVWKVNWDGGDPKVLALAQEKEEVSTGDTVAVNYIGWFDNGTVFDSSISNWKSKGVNSSSSFEDETLRPLPFTVGRGEVILGFDKGIKGMKKGEEKILDIPAEDAYGTDPSAHSLGGKDLHFKVRVESID